MVILSQASIISLKESVLEKIKNRTAIVGVIGLGYVGLPFAIEKAKVGFHVIGVDQNPLKVNQINSGHSYIDDVNEQELQTLVDAGLIRASADFNDLKEMDAIVICVPTPLTKNLVPDLQYVKHVAQEIAKRVRPGQLISLESTTYPGTTQDVILPILEASGLTVEEELYLVHSPERVDPGNTRYSTKNTNKVVGGVGPNSLEVGETFYKQTVDHVIPVSSSNVAELVKVYENTFRAVNIALVNELALLCDRMNLSVWEVLDAAFTKPFGIMPFYPGPGVGGHCIPIDPHYLEWKAKEFNFNTHFIALAGEINRRMPEYVKDKTMRLLHKANKPVAQMQVLILGVSYKKDLPDYREAPAIEVIRLLQDTVHVSYHDPHVPEIDDSGINMKSESLTEELLEQMDIVLILTDHSTIDYEWVVGKAKQVFDTRNVAKKITQYREKITLL
ncbi:nucleotide sugar dehydrogenase [Paenibacillus albiflavus]|uniref:Nucleotide sugar dehydrogenase n=1 Tax=Paenibacillus albiflavus TaxID=2545760 RepID=A0A4V2WP09_9BACL|nr:nucleotide sugar dehydrogenase [Paenibacillus albiflavus]TCZ77512.1 nucleotide sugar dehydrogenase [Paenibacillus albiflavus]